MPTTYDVDAEAPIIASFRGSLLTSWLIARALLRINPVTRWMRRTGWILIPTGFVSAVVWEQALDVGTITMAFGLMLVVIIALNPLIALWAGRGTHTTNQKWEFSSRGIRCTADQYSSTMDWSTVTKVAETKRFVVLAFSDRVKCALPKKAFNSSLPAESLEALRNRHAADPGQPATIYDGEPLMRISFKWTVHQLYQGSLEVSKRGTRLWLIYLATASVGVLASAPVVINALAAGTSVPVWVVAYPLGLGTLVFLAGRLGGYWWAYSHLSSSRSASEEQVIDVLESELRAHGKGFNAVFPYNTIIRLEESDQFILLFIAKLQALTIPKSALRDDKLEQLRQHLTAVIGKRA